MATTFKLGRRPTHFKPMTVRFTAPDGEEMEIPNVKFKYRTRKEFGAMVDAVNARNEGAYKPGPDEKFSLEKWLNAIGRNVVDILADAIESWGIDAPVSAETLSAMFDEAPAGINALNEAFAVAARDGRLGN